MYPVATMCRLLGVSASGYYAWQGRAPSARAESDRALLDRIREIHRISQGTYGAPRIHAELVEQGCAVGRKRVSRLMRRAGLRGISRRKGTRTTIRDARARPAPDLVERDFTADAPDRLWVADITFYEATLVKRESDHVSGMTRILSGFSGPELGIARLGTFLPQARAVSRGPSFYPAGFRRHAGSVPQSRMLRAQRSRRWDPSTSRPSFSPSDVRSRIRPAKRRPQTGRTGLANPVSIRRIERPPARDRSRRTATVR